jgi:hypothetical protein
MLVSLRFICSSGFVLDFICCNRISVFVLSATAHQAAESPRNIYAYTVDVVVVVVVVASK